MKRVLLDTDSKDLKLFPDEDRDPRPELGGSDKWIKLFKLIKECSEKEKAVYLYGYLLFFRIMGCRLEENKTFGHVIKPIEGEWPKGLYAKRSKELLTPYTDMLTELLQKI